MNTPDPTHMIRTTVYLPAAVISSARAAAAMRGITVAAVIRSALESGLGAYRPPPTGGFLSGKRKRQTADEP
jgi:hypothetical protein